MLYLIMITHLHLILWLSFTFLFRLALLIFIIILTIIFWNLRPRNRANLSMFILIFTVICRLIQILLMCGLCHFMAENMSIFAFLIAFLIILALIFSILIDHFLRLLFLMNNSTLCALLNWNDSAYSVNDLSLRHHLFDVMLHKRSSVFNISVSFNYNWPDNVLFFNDFINCNWLW